MTAQATERLKHEGEDLKMCTLPLREYFALAGVKPKFTSFNTANWRGYVGSWEIRDDRLYLVGLRGTLMDGEKASLATFFPGFPDRVFSHWFSGTIRAPRGKLLNYVHGGFGSTYEQDLFLEFDDGVLMETTVRQNSIDAPQAHLRVIDSPPRRAGSEDVP